MTHLVSRTILANYHVLCMTNLVITVCTLLLSPGNLVLKSVDSLDAGTYVCSESHATIVGTQSDYDGDSRLAPATWVDRPEVRLEMLTSPVARIVTTLEEAALVGESVTLSCFVGGYPAPVLAWYHNGRRLEGAHMSGRGCWHQEKFYDIKMFQRPSNVTLRFWKAFNILIKLLCWYSFSNSNVVNKNYISPSNKFAVTEIGSSF